MTRDQIGRDRPTVVLIGSPGSGKSTVGDLLAQALGEEFTDVDKCIEAREETSIADLFVSRGEPYFRALEVEETLACLTRPGVLALGGGGITQAPIRSALEGHQVVWLRCSASTAAERVGLTAARPLLLGNVRGTLVKLLAQRTPLYAAAATITVDTDGITPEDVAQTILERLSRD